MQVPTLSYGTSGMVKVVGLAPAMWPEELTLQFVFLVSQGIILHMRLSRTGSEARGAGSMWLPEGNVPEHCSLLFSARRGSASVWMFRPQL